MGLEHESTRGWDGVGIMIVGTGWVGKKFFLIQRGWDGVGYKLCRNGWGWGSLGNHLQASTLKTNLWGLLIWDFCRPNALPVPQCQSIEGILSSLPSSAGKRPTMALDERLPHLSVVYCGLGNFLCLLCLPLCFQSTFSIVNLGFCCQLLFLGILALSIFSTCPSHFSLF